MWKGARNRRLTPSPIVFSFDPGSAFERHPLLYESQTNNTQRPPLPVKQSKNINSDSRIWSIITLKILLPSHRLFLGVSAEGSLRSTVSTSIASPGGMHCFPLVNEFFGQPTSQSSSTATICLLEKIMNKN